MIMIWPSVVIVGVVMIMFHGHDSCL